MHPVSDDSTSLYGKADVGNIATARDVAKSERSDTHQQVLFSGVSFRFCRSFRTCGIGGRLWVPQATIACDFRGTYEDHMKKRFEFEGI